MNPNSPFALDPKAADKVYTQSYAKKQTIEGVKTANLRDINGEDGNFSEIVRLNDQGEIEAFPGFKLAQVNRTTQLAGSIKAWHLHFLQDEIWYVPRPFSIFVGLWDVRADSPTCGMVSRVTLDGSSPQLLYIPKGVAHGSAVFDLTAVNLYYFINQKFNAEEPDEQRIPWDAIGADFWTPQRD
jgi:dTDP-4-dehydrorhamnose 3,5-epimerase